LKKDSKAITWVPGFDGLSRENLEKIEAISTIRTFGKGETIFLEGDPGEGFYVVIRGRVKIYKASPEGKEAILHICCPGDHFGQVAVYAARTFPAGAEALETSKLLFLPRDAFVELMGKEPSLALNMLSVLSMRLRELTAQVESLALKEVPGRLASYLLYLSEKQEGGKRVVLDSSKSNLASMLGTTPETLSRIFSDFSSRGYIRVSQGEITLVNESDLKRLARQGRFGN
jgi:CRP/FNR family transcriptional regulator